MESQRRRMIWFEITKRRLLREQASTSIEPTPHPDDEKQSPKNWEDDDKNDYVSQR